MSAQLHTLPLSAASLTAEGFAPFGRLPVDEGEPGDLADLAFLWDDAHLTYIRHAGHEVVGFLHRSLGPDVDGG